VVFIGIKSKFIILVQDTHMGLIESLMKQEILISDRINHMKISMLSLMILQD